MNSKNNRVKTPLMRVLTLCAAFALSSCITVGPDHKVPEMKLPDTFSNEGVTWKKQVPLDRLKQQEWWKLYQDTVLDGLVARALANNQNIAGAAARLKQARSLSSAARGAYFPSITLGVNYTRSKSPAYLTAPADILTNYQVPVDLSYELDLWGKVRRQVEGAEASAGAASETLVAMQLSVASEVAQTYYAIRANDADSAILERSIKLRQKTLGILTKQFDTGTVTNLDVSRARTEVSNAESDLFKLQQDRVVLVNALAVLCGEVAATLTVPSNSRLPAPPEIPVSVPSELLLQRPDIRAAERRVAAANANVGVATAAYYPSIGINASTGFQTTDPGMLFKTPSNVWSLGPFFKLPITDQIFLRDRRDAEMAAHEAATAEYRQTVLDAMREVENALQGGSLITRREASRKEALESARQAHDLSTKQFEVGLISLMALIDVERTLLDAERAYSAVRAERLAMSVSLAKAVGGEW